MRTVYDLDLSNDGTYTTVPDGLYEAALEFLNPYEERVFHYLVRRTLGPPQPETHCQKLSAIAEKCKMDIKTVRKAMQKLVAVGLINRTRCHEREVWEVRINLDWCK